MPQQPQSLKTEIRKTIQCQYLLYLPVEYDPADAKPWPLLMYLHGKGERGSDLDIVKKHGPPKLIDQGQDFPFIVVSPQCPGDSWWEPQSLDALLDEIIEHYHVDEDRVYLTGLSMGGFGTWSWAVTSPHRFAAIAPICGGGSPYLADRLKGIPAWAFHGAKDIIVPLYESERMVKAMKEAGGNVIFTVYPEAGHESWTQTYENPKLYEWLLKHRRHPS